MVAALAVSGCGDIELRAPSELSRVALDTSVSQAPQPVLTAAPPTPNTFAEDPRAGLPVPSVWRITIEGTVSEGDQAVPIALDGWMLVNHPYDEHGASQNDFNVVDIGIRTDLDMGAGRPGALWFGTNSALARDLQIPAEHPGTDADVVTERRDDEVVHADLVAGLAPLDSFNLYTVGYQAAGAEVNSILTGSLSVRFAADGSSVTGRIDLGGTAEPGGSTSASRYEAAITGQRHVED